MWAMQTMIADGNVTEGASCAAKTAYSQGGAHRAKLALRKSGRHRRHLVTIYHCRFCGHYHLSSIGG